MKQGKRSIKAKILTTYFILSAILVLFISGIVFYAFNVVISKNVLENNSYFAMKIIDKAYEGDWIVNRDRLFKGSRIINDEYEILDEIKRITNADVTIFLNDIRISTTIEKDGKRMVGTKASDKVIEEVINKGNVYRGSADILGKKYVTIYRPIKNSTGKVVGMFFIGYPQSYVFGIIKNAIFYIFLCSFVLVVLGIMLFNILIKKNIINPINILNKNLVSMSELDFTVEVSDKLINRRDEIGDMFKCLDKMIITLKDMVQKLSNSSTNLFEESTSLSSISHEMAASSEQVAASIEQISSGAQQQANSIEDILNVVEKLSDSIEEVENQLNKVKDEVENTEFKAKHGKEEMDKLIHSIEEIRTAFNTVVEKVEGLNNSVSNISSIADVINGISEQTNLLALNAAIEAARAGEAGRGFAVVADEVRKLAEESKKSTDEIIDIIRTIQGETSEVINTSNNVGKFIEKQTEAVENTVTSFGDILSSVENITPLIKSTFDTVNYMVEYKDETANKVDSVNQVVVENVSVTQEVNASSEELTASSEEVAAASQKLSELAEELKDIVNRFKI